MTPPPSSPAPVDRFEEALARARAVDPQHFNAMCLATVGADGRPSARMVLLKGVDDRGLVFYTNLGSRKAHDLALHPVASACFFWPAIYEQVRVEGDVESVTAAEADAYFASRARGSQIGAWASHQSDPLGSRDELVDRVAAYEQRFQGQDVPRPPNWSGFRILPRAWEFWVGQPSRLHERTLYERSGNGWKLTLLNP